MKIAKYGLDNWVDLREYTPMDTVRQQLKLCSRQYNLYMKTVVSLQNNLISLTDKTFPGVNELFSSPERADGHQKWVDFVMTFWHCDCICRVSEKAFTEHYQKWCMRKGYHFSAEKALDVYAGSCGHFTTLPKNDNTKLLITTAAQQLLAGKMTLAALRAEMTRLAKQLPEYDTVRAMYGVGETTAVQLMAEIGDVRRFLRRSSIVGFAGVDPAVNQSGKHSAKSVPTTKRGSPHLRKTLYQIVCTYLKKSPVDEPVYQFLDKKRSEGKPYFVYMTAAQNKFLRIYYAHAKECLETFDAQRDILTQCDPKGHLHLKLVINFVPIHLHHLQTFSLELLNPFADIIPYYPCFSQCFQWFPRFFAPFSKHYLISLPPKPKPECDGCPA